MYKNIKITNQFFIIYHNFLKSTFLTILFSLQLTEPWVQILDSGSHQCHRMTSLEISFRKVSKWRKIHPKESKLMCSNFTPIKTPRKKKRNFSLNAQKWTNGLNCSWVWHSSTRLSENDVDMDLSDGTSITTLTLPISESPCDSSNRCSTIMKKYHSKHFHISQENAITVER